VNKQVNYIVSAHLILAVAIGSLFIADKLPSTLLQEEELTETVYRPTDMSGKPLTEVEQKGKTLFSTNCAPCHKLGMDMTGPDLVGFEQRGPWTDRKKFYEWLQNPSAFMKKDKYTKDLEKKFPTMMASFGHLTKEEMDAIAEYISQ
jgi:hypothetical protein